MAKSDKCPWCGKSVTLSDKDRLKPHLSPGGVQCIGSGMTLGDLFRNRPEPALPKQPKKK
jgi:hypothetical protein